MTYRHAVMKSREVASIRQWQESEGDSVGEGNLVILYSSSQKGKEGCGMGRYCYRVTILITYV